MTQLNAQAVSALLSAPLIGADLAITSAAPLSSAEAGALSFVVDPEKHQAPFTRAMEMGAVILAPLGTLLPEGASGALILTENPRAAFGRVLAEHFVPRPESGIAPTARIHPSATVHETAHIGEYTVVREGAVIHSHAEIRDHVVIGRNVVIGEHALIKSHAVIGEEGFGIERDDAGNNFHLPHIGSAVVGSHAEVGSFTTVCSGTITPTEIGEYTKIDDHVHIAHNCKLGRNVIVTACAEVSGSVTLEDDVWLGPNSSIIQGVTLGKNSLLGIGAVATKGLPANEVWAGNPARRLGDNKK